MLTEANRAILVDDIEKNVDYSYEDYNTGSKVFIFRDREPITRELPSVMMRFLPTGEPVGARYNNYLKEESGYAVYGYGELEAIRIVIYTHQMCEGTGSIHHGKIIADDYIRKIETRIRKYWPKMLWDMEARLREANFMIDDISDFLQGTERQGFELSFFIVSTRKWDYKPEGVESGNTFNDACLSGMDQASYDAGEEYTKIFSISGYMTR
jgi:hypothetical protein